MFALIGKFSLDARRALFGALGDAVRTGKSSVTSNQVALRCAGSRGTPITSLLSLLEAPALGQGTYDELRSMFERSIAEEEVESAAGEEPPLAWIPKPGGFTALPLAADARQAFEEITATFRNVPDESVTPKAVMRVLQGADPNLAGYSKRTGLHPPASRYIPAV
jgi:hypothetical protein